MNDVIVSVSAMKKTPIKPPRPSLCDEAFKRKLGRLSSNSPSRLRPKTTKSAATNRFSQGLLASVCSELAEKKNEKSTPTAVKTPMIDRQYMIARPVAFFRPEVPCPCLTKKLTVIGTIGQTQGITSANSPPIAEAIRKGISPAWAFWAISL